MPADHEARELREIASIPTGEKNDMLLFIPQVVKVGKQQAGANDTDS